MKLIIRNYDQNVFFANAEPTIIRLIIRAGSSVSSGGGGSAVWGGITGTLSAQTDLQTALDGKVNDTGNETIAGVKTFSSDPIIPDEVYGVGWNGSLEPPTKNAVYDKIETIGGGATWGGITGTLSNQTDLQTALDTKVNDTGNETIAGIKTFSSDPIIPDEAYGAGWNGSLEPPTKNAVYDKIETLTPGGASIDYSTIFLFMGG